MASLALSGLAGRYGLLGPIRNMAASLLRTNTGRKFAKEGGRQLVGQALPGAAITSVLGTLTTGNPCLLYTSPSPRDRTRSRMPSSA